MRRNLMIIGAATAPLLLLLVGCGEDVTFKPYRVCLDTEIRGGGRGGPYTICVRHEEEIRCPRPLMLGQKANGTLFCRFVEGKTG